MRKAYYIVWDIAVLIFIASFIWGNGFSHIYHYINILLICVLFHFALIAPWYFQLVLKHSLSFAAPKDYNQEEESLLSSFLWIYLLWIIPWTFALALHLKDYGSPTTIRFWKAAFQLLGLFVPIIVAPAVLHLLIFATVRRIRQSAR